MCMSDLTFTEWSGEQEEENEDEVRRGGEKKARTKDRRAGGMREKKLKGSHLVKLDLRTPLPLSFHPSLVFIRRNSSIVGNSVRRTC